MVAGSATALAVTWNASWTAFWGNPVIPSLLAALLAGVVVSFLAPRRDIAEEEALRRFGDERSTVEAEPGAAPSRSPEG